MARSAVGGRHKSPSTSTLDQLALWSRASGLGALVSAMALWVLPWVHVRAASPDASGSTITAYWLWGTQRTVPGTGAQAIRLNDLAEPWTALVTSQAIGTAIVAAAVVLLVVLVIEDLAGRQGRVRFMGPIAALLLVCGGGLFVLGTAFAAEGRGFGITVGALVAAASALLATASGAAAQTVQRHRPQATVEGPRESDWVLAESRLHAAAPPRAPPWALRQSARDRWRALGGVRLGLGPGPALYVAIVLFALGVLLPWAHAEADVTEVESGQSLGTVGITSYSWGFEASVIREAPGIELEALEGDRQHWFASAQTTTELALIRFAFGGMILAALMIPLVAFHALRGDINATRTSSLALGVLLLGATALHATGLIGGVQGAQAFALSAGPFAALAGGLLWLAPIGRRVDDAVPPADAGTGPTASGPDDGTTFRPSEGNP